MSSPQLKVGARVLYDGDVWSVEGLDGCSVRLRETSGRLALVATRELVGAPDLSLGPGCQEHSLEHSRI